VAKNNCAHAKQFIIASFNGCIPCRMQKGGTEYDKEDG
jgi:hypothetical protein